VGALAEDAVIRRLRARHRAIFALLAVLVPAAYAAALLGRRAPPQASAWPDEGISGASEGAARTVMWSQVELLTATARTADGALRVRALSWSEPAPPGLALYWSAGDPGGELPDGARFVGALGPATRDFELRDVAADGWLVLYSLGHGETLGALALAEDG
jgi:hypothetical protein